MTDRILVRSISNLPIGKLARANGPSLSFVGLCLKPPGTLEMLIHRTCRNGKIMKCFVNKTRKCWNETKDRCRMF